MPSLEQLLPLLAAEPEDVFLRYAVAMEYARLERHEEALKEFGALLQRSPDYVAGYFMAGRTCQKQGDMERAKAYYRDGVAAARRTGDERAVREISDALAVIE